MPEFTYFNCWRHPSGKLNTTETVFSGDDERDLERQAFEDAMQEFPGLTYAFTVRTEQVPGGREARSLDWSEEIEAVRATERDMRDLERRQHGLRHEELV